MDQSPRLLVGDEVLREESIRKYCKQVPDWDQRLFSGRDLDLSVFLSEIRNFSFFSTGTLFRIKQVDELVTADKKSLIQGLSGEIPPHGVILEADELDYRDALYKHFQSLGKLELLKSTPQRVENWLVEMFKKKNIEIRPEALELLVDRCGSNFSAAKESLQKILLSVNGGTVEVDHVLSLSAEANVYNSFQLIEALEKGDATEVFRIAAYLFQDAGVSPFEILGLLNWHYRRLWTARQKLAQGVSSTQIGKELRIGHSFLNAFISQARRHKRSDLKQKFSDLYHLDYASKTGGMDAESGLEMTLAKWLL